MIDTVNAFLKKEYGTYVEASSLCIDLMVGPRESSAVIGTDTFIYLTTCDKQKVARLKDLMRMLQIKQDDNYIVDICSAM